MGALIDLAIAGGGGATALGYSSVAVAVYKVRVHRTGVPLWEGCTDCKGGHRRGTYCMHWEHNRHRAHFYPAVLVAVFWLPVGIGHLFAKCGTGTWSVPTRLGDRMASRYIAPKSTPDRIRQKEIEAGIDG